MTVRFSDKVKLTTVEKWLFHISPLATVTCTKSPAVLLFNTVLKSTVRLILTLSTDTRTSFGINPAASAGIPGGTSKTYTPSIVGANPPTINKTPTRQAVATAIFPPTPAAKALEETLAFAFLSCCSSTSTKAPIGTNNKKSNPLDFTSKPRLRATTPWAPS